MTFYIVLNQYREAEKAFAAVAHYGATLPPLHIVALKYAVANGPCDMSRAFASEDAVTAYYYARDVDKCPRDDTRREASRNWYWKNYYKISFPANDP